MTGQGRVVGGDYLNAMVQTLIGSDVVVQSGLKWRKLTAQNVAAWQEIKSAQKGSTASAVGQAVASAVLPRFMSKSASAAVGATIDTTIKPPHIIRVDWSDGKRSLIKMPNSLFKHFSLVLESRMLPAEEIPVSEIVAVAEAPDSPGLAEQALTHLADIVKDRLLVPGRTKTPAIETKNTSASVITGQITKLSELRDAGVLTEDEFTAKKTELLSRL